MLLNKPLWIRVNNTTINMNNIVGFKMEPSPKQGYMRFMIIASDGSQIDLFTGVTAHVDFLNTKLLEVITKPGLDTFWAFDIKKE